MDVNDPVHNATWSWKLSEEWDMDMSRNRIGNLPDGILEHILSFLPTKDAVKTSVLSKKWQYLWMSVPSFVFEEEQLDTRALFMKFVERALVVRTSNLEKFMLTCDILADALCINAWVLGVVRHKVQKLYLSLYNIVQPFVLPHCLFSCESITVLELCMGLYLQIPYFICFSSLKKLTLRDVIFPEENSTQQLFSGCPVLEELYLLDCNWENVEGVSISAPKLACLVIVEPAYDQNNSNACLVIIFGTNLKSLIYVGDLLNDFCFYDSPSLVDAGIKVGKRDREVAYRAHKLLQGLSSVKDLSTTVDTVEGLWSGTPCEKDDLVLDPVPPCLLTHLKTIKVSDFWGIKDEMEVLKILIKNGMVLEKILLKNDFRGRITWEIRELLSLPRESMMGDGFVMSLSRVSNTDGRGKIWVFVE